MAIEVETSGQVEEFIRIIRQRAWWIAIPFVLVTALGSAFAVIVPKKFVARTTVQVRNTLAGMPGDTGQSMDEARNAPYQIKSGTRITQVLEALQWTDYLQLSRTEIEPYIENISKNLKVDLPQAADRKDLQVVKISFADTDPDRAYEFLVKMSELWRNEVLERGRTSQLQAYQALEDEQLEKNLRRSEINDKLRELRQRFQLDPSQTVSRGGYILSTSDPVYQQTQQDHVKLDELEAELAAKTQELTRGQEMHDRMPPTVKRNLQGSQGVNNQVQIADLRSKLKQLTDEMGRYKKDHSKYKLASKEKRDLEEQIQVLEVGEEDPVSQEQDIPNPERMKLADAIEEQKLELARLKDQRDLLRERVRESEQRISELADVYRDIEDYEHDRQLISEELATLAREIQSKKMAHLRLSGAEGNPFDTLDIPRKPGRPTEPDPILIVVFSMLIGLALGSALALISEYSKNCFRSVGDVSRVLVVPVLGAINQITTRRDRMRVRWAHSVVGGVTFVFVSTLAFVTWAWKTKPEILSSSLRQTIEEFRDGFK